MNYYTFHIGDYLSATAHLSILEHGAYRRLLDVYYINEAPIPLDERQVYRLVGARAKEEKEAVDVVLGEFFTRTDSGYWHQRCDHEISRCNRNRTNGVKGGRPPKNTNPEETQLETETKPRGNPEETQLESPQTPKHPNTQTPKQEKPLSPPSEAPDLAIGSGQQDRLPCPVNEIVRLYHELMPMNPRCRVINTARSRTIASRWREAASLDADPFNGGYATREDGLAKWREFFSICNESKFLTGKVQSFNGRPPFIADIDFLFSPSGFAKTLENRYHREAA